MNRTTPLRRILLASLLLAVTSLVGAQTSNYPRGPVKLVVNTTPGGTVDTMARLLAEGLSTQLKQTVVVDYRPGGNGIIATDFVAKSRPDGYTLLLATSSLTTLPLLQKNIPYNGRDLVPVALTGATPFLLFAGPTSQASSLANLVSYAKANPERLSVATADGVTRMVSELFNAATGIKVTTVNYRSGQQAIVDIAGGSVDYAFLGATVALPLAKAGKLRVLGVAGGKRLDIAPDVPTLAEQGIKGVLMEAWTGIMVPRGTDRDIVQILERALAITAQSEAFQTRLSAIGSVSRFIGSSDAAAFMAAEQQTLEQVAASAGIKPAD